MLKEMNIEAELSYAYLHAVASRAGFSCEYRNSTVPDSPLLMLANRVISGTCVENGSNGVDHGSKTSISAQTLK